MDGGYGDTTSLIFGQDPPACFPNRATFILMLPITDHADAGLIRPNDIHMPLAGVGNIEIALVTIEQLLFGFWPAEIVRHFRRVTSPEDREVILRVPPQL